jgi:hypothetical protein
VYLQTLLPTRIDLKSRRPDNGTPSMIWRVREMECTNLEAYKALSDGIKGFQRGLGMGIAGLISDDFVQ